MIEKNLEIARLIGHKISKNGLIEKTYLAKDVFSAQNLLKQKPVEVIFLGLDLSQEFLKTNKSTKNPIALLIDPDYPFALKPSLIKRCCAIVTLKASPLELGITIAAIKGHRKKLRGSKLRCPVGKVPKLTDQEIEVLHQVAQGRSNLEIARELKIGLATVKTHLQRIFGKLNSRDKTHSVAQGLRWRILN
ncbi:MAG: LuxR C-terminal-related transcriptional regulator [Candidatus Nanopelagicales bacterium]|nr:LuxR C-terminal-related transcriptional regulator [Candidatus Nanopelagicales bacterium]MDP4746437.1 LuxR C-terminal-related transcriptional regulator [Candidatus Nanopelagicales bacterium]MDP4986351.1 LuxR C-terminal-related transcriptional regulator [Candidatus Nanopelagicales bacterium]